MDCDRDAPDHGDVAWIRGIFQGDVGRLADSSLGVRRKIRLDGGCDLGYETEISWIFGDVVLICLKKNDGGLGENLEGLQIDQGLIGPRSGPSREIR